MSIRYPSIESWICSKWREMSNYLNNIGWRRHPRHYKEIKRGKNHALKIDYPHKNRIHVKNDAKKKVSYPNRL